MNELRFAGRRLARSPAFASVAVTLLGLGIGASTAIFSAVDAVVLEPLVPDEDRVAVMYPRDVETNVPFTALSIPDFRDWRASASSFDGIAGFGNQSGSFSLILPGGNHDIRATAVTPSFFDVAGVPPLLGRGFLPGEDRAESERVVVFSHDVWRTVFGGDADLVGRQVTLDDERFLVVGVMPPGFDFPNQTGLWAVARFEPPVNHRGWGYLLTLARVSAGVSMDAARAEMEIVDDHLLDETGRGDLSRRHVEMVPVLDFFLGQRTRSTFVVLTLAVGLMFLVACVNVASLIAAKSVARKHELDVMTALGATRADLARAFLAEAALLSLGGAVLGGVLAALGLRVILSVAPATVPRLATARIDPDALFFAAAASAAVAVAVALTPVLRATRRPIATSGRWSQTVVSFEIAATVVLVVGASLLVHSVFRLMRADLGYRPENVVIFSVVSPTDPVEAPDAHRALMTRLMAHAEALPDVEAAGIVMLPPFQSGSAGWDLWWVSESQGLPVARRERVNPDNPDEKLVYFGPPPEAFDESPRVVWEAVSGSYFRAMGIPLLRGRPFDAQDDANAPRVVIVSDSFARATWPNEDPIGRRMMTLGFRYDENRRAEWQTVVGVVADARYRELHAARRDVYVPYLQSPLVPSTIVLRARGAPMAPIPALDDMARTVHPALRVERVRSLRSVVENELTPWRFNSMLVTAFAVAAWLIASLGVFATLSFTVAERRREIGIRMALGATAHDVLAWVLARGMRVVVVGLGCGVAVTALLSRYLAAHLYETAPLSVTIYSIVSISILAVAAIASAVPAHRAVRTDPTDALRAD